jgi:hypothetical protein
MCILTSLLELPPNRGYRGTDTRHPAPGNKEIAREIHQPQVWFARQALPGGCPSGRHGIKGSRDVFAPCFDGLCAGGIVQPDK